jgi:filamin
MFSFIVDARGTGGLGDVIIDIVHDKQSLAYRMEDFGHMQYRISFVPGDAGKYRIYVYFNGSDVRGSPFSIRVGTQKGSRKLKESSLERSKMLSLEQRMNGLNIFATEQSSPTQKMYTSTMYKSISPTQRCYSPIHQVNSTYKTSSSNYATENITSTCYNTNRSPNHLNLHSPIQRNVHSPAIFKETNEIYGNSSTVHNHRSKSPNMQSPLNFMKESKDIYSFSTLNSPQSPDLKPIIKESKDIYNSGSLKRSRSPICNSIAYNSSVMQSPVNRNFSPKNEDWDVSASNRRIFMDNSVIDTSSNVRVSSMISGTSRRDSWDAIAKTKSLLSYGSLESLTNLTNNSPSMENRPDNQNNSFLNNNYKNAQNYSVKNISSHESISTSYSPMQKSLNSDYGIAKKNNNNIQLARQSHGILKNKNNNYDRNMDITDDATRNRYLNTDSPVCISRSIDKSDSVIATGRALDILSVHQPNIFSINSDIDSNMISVTIIGKFQHDLLLIRLIIRTTNILYNKIQLHIL